MLSSFELKDRPGQELLAGAKRLVSQERDATAHLIAHLSEIDDRHLYLEEGCSSLFKYCTEVLHLSESEAYNRIDVARIARRFPVVFPMLAEGLITLTTVRTLGSCLTAENHRGLLQAAKHKSKEEVEKLAVSIRPRPEVPNVVRKLPGSREEPLTRGEVSGSMFEAVDPALAAANGRTGTAPEQQPSDQPAPIPVRSPPSQKIVVSPLSPEHYKMQLMVDAETVQTLRQLQELLRHQVPNGDPATIVKDALLLRLDQVKRERLAQVKRPRATAPKRSEKNGRHIAAEVKRTVWQRDGGRCAFVSKSGRRCSERARLEFHHLKPYAWDGRATTENIALRCRAHNAHEGEILFGSNGKKLTCSGTSSDPDRRAVIRRR